jgi:hypothetical protein
MLAVGHVSGERLWSRAYPRIISRSPRWFSPRALIGLQSSSRISLAKRRHAPAPRLRWGTSALSRAIGAWFGLREKEQQYNEYRSNRNRLADGPQHGREN